MKEENHTASATVKQMQEYIKAKLQEPITASDIAKSVGYSQFYAAKLFKSETGISLFEYVRQQRLIESAYTLREGKARVLTVALDFVFDSHEGFTRAFTNAFGITPKKYSSYPNPSGWLIPYRYLDRHKSKREEKLMEQKASFIFVQIVDRPARKLILRRSKKAEHYFEYMEEIGCRTPEKKEVWDLLCDIKEALYEPVGVWLPKNMRPEGTGVYAHAVEVSADYAGEIPDGFDIFELPPCQYLIFQGEPYDDEQFEQAVGSCMDYIDKYNPEAYGYEWAEELGPKFQLAPMGWRGYIEGRPIRKLTK